MDEKSGVIKWSNSLKIRQVLHFIFVYVKGKENKATDCLSRLFLIRESDLLEKSSEDVEEDSGTEIETAEEAYPTSDHTDNHDERALDTLPRGGEKSIIRLLAWRMRVPSVNEEAINELPAGGPIPE